MPVLIVVASSLVAIGVACFALAAGDLVADLASAGAVAVRRRGARGGLLGLRTWLLPDGPMRSDTGGAAAVADLIMPVAVGAAGAIGAVLARDALLSPAILGIALVAAWTLRLRRRGREMRVALDSVQALVEAFQSSFAVHRSAFRPLEETVPYLPAGEVRSAVERAIARYHLNRPLVECWLALRALRNAYLDEFTFILERIQTADMALTSGMLAKLATRLARQRARTNRARVTTARLRGTVRVLQGALAAAVGTSLTFDLWRSYWLASLSNRVLFVILVACGLAMSGYFEQRIQALSEEFA